MSDSLPSYDSASYRVISPSQTLARLRPHWDGFGITRCADIHGLDTDLGVPVHVAIRPRGRVFQSSAGKGPTVAAARASALMEAVEFDVAERPDRSRLRRTCLAELVAEGQRVDALPEWLERSCRFFSDRFRFDWVQAEDLIDGGAVWVPAGAAYFCEPSPCRTNSNGLASGNHPVEATLHGLHEVIERDAFARLITDGRLSIRRDCRVLDPCSIDVPFVTAVMAKIAAADSKLVVLELRSGLPVPTFWAVLLNRQPFAGGSALNAGFGTHLDAGVALTRAVTEAIQTRLTMIHGARDDIVDKPAYVDQVRSDSQVERSAAYHYFDALEPNTELPGPLEETVYEPVPCASDLRAGVRALLSLLRRAGHERVYRVELGCPVPAFSVVKIVAPSLRFSPALW